ncbi:MAG: DUF3108 domain-containing protein [Candidatus Goldbacteria bacterium]|nr:DUF3108 domain-containing protein [Candidatus Goldiibacteriota bacterium]
MKKLLIFFLIAFIIGCAGSEKKVNLIKELKEEKIIKEQVEKISEQKEKVIINQIEYSKYIVRKGDSLWRIAKEQIGNPNVWIQIAIQNKINEPYILRPGQIILLSDSYKINDKKKKNFKYRVIKNNSFGVGEKLVFAIKYFGITAGFGILEVKNFVEINKRKAYFLEATAKTSPFFERFYRVHDVINSYMDAYGLFSWKYSKNLEEGSYRNNSYMEFYHEEGYAKKKEGDRCSIPAFVQDVLSEFYYYRAIFTGKEEELYIDVASDECKVYQIVVKKLGEERVRVDAGEFDCYVIRPFLKYEGIFRQKGDVDIWLTKDKYKMPVLVKSKIIIGSIDAVLQEATIVEPE